MQVLYFEVKLPCLHFFQRVSLFFVPRGMCFKELWSLYPRPCSSFLFASRTFFLPSEPSPARRYLLHMHSANQRPWLLAASSFLTPQGKGTRRRRRQHSSTKCSMLHTLQKGKGRQWFFLRKQANEKIATWGKMKSFCFFLVSSAHFRLPLRRQTQLLHSMKNGWNQ